MSVSFAYFVEVFTPAWTIAWRHNKTLTIACCAWFDVFPPTIQKLGSCNDAEESIMICAYEVRKWTQDQANLFCEALCVLDGPPPLAPCDEPLMTPSITTMVNGGVGGVVGGVPLVMASNVPPPLIENIEGSKVSVSAPRLRVGFSIQKRLDGCACEVCRLNKIS